MVVPGRRPGSITMRWTINAIAGLKGISSAKSLPGRAPMVAIATRRGRRLSEFEAAQGPTKTTLARSLVELPFDPQLRTNANGSDPLNLVWGVVCQGVPQGLYPFSCSSVFLFDLGTRFFVL